MARERTSFFRVVAPACPRYKQRMSQENKTAFISAGAVRVGRAVALHLAQRGWNVAFQYGKSGTEATSLVKEIEALGRKALGIPCDLSAEPAPEKLIAQAASAFGPVHLLINNVSAFEKDSLEDISAESFRAHMDINVRVALGLIRGFVEQVETHTIMHANIINFSDGIMGWSISPSFLSYSLSKICVAALPQLLAVELAPHIRINTIALGPTLPGHMDKPDTFDKIASLTPLERVSSTEEVCHTIDYILGAPSFTGQTLMLSGGLHLKPAKSE